jgi:hypothetical protein
LIVVNTTLTNIIVGGSSGISSGLFYLYMPSSDYYYFEVWFDLFF